MAILSFSAEIICELDASFMYVDDDNAIAFEFEYEVHEDPGMTREELVQMGEDLASRRFWDYRLLNHIMDNTTVFLRLENVSMDND